MHKEQANEEIYEGIGKNFNPSATESLNGTLPSRKTRKGHQPGLKPVTSRQKRPPIVPRSAPKESEPKPSIMTFVIILVDNTATVYEKAFKMPEESHLNSLYLHGLLQQLVLKSNESWEAIDQKIKTLFYAGPLVESSHVTLDGWTMLVRELNGHVTQGSPGLFIPNPKPHSRAKTAKWSNVVLIALSKGSPNLSLPVSQNAAVQEEITSKGKEKPPQCSPPPLSKEDEDELPPPGPDNWQEADGKVPYSLIPELHQLLHHLTDPLRSFVLASPEKKSASIWFQLPEARVADNYINLNNEVQSYAKYAVDFYEAPTCDWGDLPNFGNFLEGAATGLKPHFIFLSSMKSLSKDADGFASQASNDTSNCAFTNALRANVCFGKAGLGPIVELISSLHNSLAKAAKDKFLLQDEVKKYMTLLNVTFGDVLYKFVSHFRSTVSCIYWDPTGIAELQEALSICTGLAIFEFRDILGMDFGSAINHAEILSSRILLGNKGVNTLLQTIFLPLLDGDNSQSFDIIGTDEYPEAIEVIDIFCGQLAKKIQIERKSSPKRPRAQTSDAETNYFTKKQRNKKNDKAKAQASFPISIHSTDDEMADVSSGADDDSAPVVNFDRRPSFPYPLASSTTFKSLTESLESLTRRLRKTIDAEMKTIEAQFLEKTSKSTALKFLVELYPHPNQNRRKMWSDFASHSQAMIHNHVLSQVFHPNKSGPGYLADLLDEKKVAWQLKADAITKMINTRWNNKTRVSTV
ncbi:hypothetical protein DXG01_001299 [Tephrocybe rancida]|nr:hypothetical protein DXG01_001299 [Tephrocybe rancida]